MSFISESVKNDILAAQEQCDEAIRLIEHADRALDKFDFGRLVVLPCCFGERLWWCYEDDDNGNVPIVEQSEPVRGFLVKPSGECLVTFDDECFDGVGGPYLFLTEKEARAEAVRLVRKLQKEGK